jgi:hypothetical protein
VSGRRATVDGQDAYLGSEWLVVAELDEDGWVSALRVETPRGSRLGRLLVTVEAADAERLAEAFRLAQADVDAVREGEGD